MIEEEGAIVLKSNQSCQLYKEYIMKTTNTFSTVTTGTAIKVNTLIAANTTAAVIGGTFAGISSILKSTAVMALNSDNQYVKKAITANPVNTARESAEYVYKKADEAVSYINAELEEAFSTDK
jgi:ABC-type phosphate/phosphonate transport system ATPase subunit